MIEEGGDGPCWAELVCDACGALVGDRHHDCARPGFDPSVAGPSADTSTPTSPITDQ
jgi:hypothetical protein